MQSESEAIIKYNMPATKSRKCHIVMTDNIVVIKIILKRNEKGIPSIGMQVSETINCPFSFQAQPCEQVKGEGKKKKVKPNAPGDKFLEWTVFPRRPFHRIKS